MITFSIIIPTFNNYPVIYRVGKRLEKIIKTRNDTEILIVDSSTDGSTVRLQQNLKYSKIIHPVNRILPGPARNLGADQAKGKYLIFLDGDCYPSLKWLSAFSNDISYLDSNIVCGGVNLYPGSDLSQFMEYVMWKLPECSRVKKGPYHYVITENMMISRSNFKKTGGFQESDSANDAQMDESRQNANLKIFFDPHALVFHIHPHGWVFHLRKMNRIGREQLDLIHLKKYKVGRQILFTLPFVFIIRWFRVTYRLIRYQPHWLPRYIFIQPLFILALLSQQLGLWQGLFYKLRHV